MKASETKRDWTDPELAQAWMDMFVFDESHRLPSLAEIITELMSLEESAPRPAPVIKKQPAKNWRARDPVAEQKVLQALRDADCDNPGSPYLSFALLTARTGLDEKIVRRSARGLSEDGFIKYGRGSHWVDGVNIGSGYAITDAARIAKPQRPSGLQATIIRRRLTK